MNGITCPSCGAAVVTGIMPAGVRDAGEDLASMREDAAEQRWQREQQAMISALGEAGYESPWYTGTPVTASVTGRDYRGWREARNLFAQTGADSARAAMLGYVSTDCPPLASDVTPAPRQPRMPGLTWEDGFDKLVIAIAAIATLFVLLAALLR
jgi:hypothetical protein